MGPRRGTKCWKVGVDHRWKWFTSIAHSQRDFMEEMGFELGSMEKVRFIQLMLADTFGMLVFFPSPIPISE